GDARVRTPTGAGLPGRHRGLQRLLAEPGLGTLPTPRLAGSAKALGPACRGPASPPSRAPRGSPPSPPLPPGLGVGCADAGAGPVGLPATDQRAGGGGGVGPLVRGGSAVGEPFGPPRGGPEGGASVGLPPATTRANGSAAAEGDPSSNP